MSRSAGLLLAIASWLVVTSPAAFASSGRDGHPAAGAPVGTAGGAAATPPPLPQRLHDTGLFVAPGSRQVSPGVLEFSPQYPLWTDGATKRRWIALPPGRPIDARHPDAWEFPAGTRLWKEFAFGRAVETRYIERLADGSWRFATYVWNEAGTDASLAPEAGLASLPGAPGGVRHAIPSRSDCRACHEGAKVPVLGFSALQLSPDRDPLAPHAEPVGRSGTDLRSLVTRGWLRNLPTEFLRRPPRIAAATPVERAALGYLHGNCGHCHAAPDAQGGAVPVDVRLAYDVSDPASADHVRRSLIGAASRFRGAGAGAPPLVIAPGRAHESVLPMRMLSRDPRVQMPPLGTSIPDTEALALIQRWIDLELNPPKESRP